MLIDYFYTPTVGKRQIFAKVACFKVLWWLLSARAKYQLVILSTIMVHPGICLPFHGVSTVSQVTEIHSWPSWQHAVTVPPSFCRSPKALLGETLPPSLWQTLLPVKLLDFEGIFPPLQTDPGMCWNAMSRTVHQIRKPRSLKQVHHLSAFFPFSQYISPIRRSKIKMLDH